jgi:IS1 family transposase
LIEQVNYKWLQEKNNRKLEVMLVKAEVDEMESYVGKKKYQRWLWHAIDHKTGTILAFVLGIRIKRLQRKTICFSKIAPMHDLVIGLYINKYEFGREI